MPELPEVETFRCYFNRYALRKTIRGVTVSDPKNFPGMSKARIGRHLVGRQFLKATRRGKYLIAPLDAGESETRFRVPGSPLRAEERQAGNASRAMMGGKWKMEPLSPDGAQPLSGGGHVVIHFGMTGRLSFSKVSVVSPPYSRTGFLFDDGVLHYVDMRRFGGLWWVADLGRFERVKILGADALSEIDSH